MAALPPGPANGLPVLLRYLRDPYGATLKLFERWGDPQTSRALGPPLVSTADPVLIKSILAASPDTFEAFGVDLLGPALGRESLILLSGERHKAARKLLTPPFHGERMRAYGHTMQTIAREEVRSWRAGVPFSIQGAMQRISLRVILKAVFGMTNSPEHRDFEKLLVSAIDALKPELLFIKALQRPFGGFGPWARFLRQTGLVETFINAELAARRANPAPREDILSLVMSARYDDGSAMTDRQLFETLMTIVVAGHETTAIAASWACYFLHRDDAVKATLLAELATLPADPTPESIVGLPYLEAVCQEALRLHPVAPTIIRTLRQPFQLGQWLLPAGVDVGASIIGLHQRADLYPQPQVFRPERFLERSFAPNEYLPFGGGYRRCIGAAFALYELKIVLATLLTERPLTLVTKGPVKARPRSTIIAPAAPIRFVAA